MPTTTMSISRALAEVKRLDERIARATTGGTFVLATIGEGTHQRVHGTNMSREQAVRTIQSSYDQVEDLIRNRRALKAAIILSNANTKVVVLSQEVTVAEAIDMKSMLPAKEALLSQLRTQLLHKRQLVETGNAAVEQGIEKLLTTAYGADKSKIDSAIHDAIATPQRAQKAMALLDPNRIEDEIRKLEEEISVLKTEIDFVLSESNARTTISVDF